LSVPENNFADAPPVAIVPLLCLAGSVQNEDGHEFTLDSFAASFITLWVICMESGY
jgi:hypothetical protein